MMQSLKTIAKAERSPYETMKMALGFGLGVAADTTVTLALKSLLPAVKGWKGLLVRAGVFVLSMMAGEKVEQYVYYVVDDTQALLGEAKQELLGAEDEGKGEQTDA